MTQQATSTPDANKAPASKQPLVPPDEQFWQHYSPHHEAPLSGVTSLGLHIVAIGLLILGGILIFRDQQLKAKPVTVDTAIAPDDLPPVVPPGGGGGSKFGKGAIGGQDTEDVGPKTDGDKPRPGPEVGTLPAVPGTVGKIELPQWGNSHVEDLIQQGNLTAPVIQRLNEDLRDKLRRGLRASEGQGEVGTGTGKGGGEGTGEGTGTGPGKGSKREERILRWSMIFSTLNGEDYARQLNSLGAYLAVADPEDATQFRVYRDLKPRPVKGQIEDIAQIKRIFWVDDKPESVQRLSTALGIRPVPGRIIAFFPEELEKKLLKLELDFMGRKEEEIAETRFEIVPIGPGRYTPRVVSQRKLH